MKIDLVMKYGPDDIGVQSAQKVNIVNSRLQLGVFLKLRVVIYTSCNIIYIKKLFFIYRKLVVIVWQETSIEYYYNF